MEPHLNQYDILNGGYSLLLMGLRGLYVVVQTATVGHHTHSTILLLLTLTPTWFIK